MPGGQQQRLAADDALQLAERDDRSGKRDRAHEHADERFHLVDPRLDALERVVGIERAAKPDQHRRQADETVKHGDELRHGRHFDPRRQRGTDAAADHERAEQHAVTGGMRSEGRDAHRQCHPNHAVQVPAPRRFLRGEPAEAEDEQDAGDEIRDGDERLRQASPRAGY